MRGLGARGSRRSSGHESVGAAGGDIAHNPEGLRFWFVAGLPWERRPLVQPVCQASHAVDPKWIPSGPGATRQTTHA